ncbi:MAG: hypothetical protein J6Q52_04770 [Clostridia bacterium]|nr:hypothetical protein [Clostridia bacterium]
MFEIIADIFTNTPPLVILTIVVGITLIVLEMFNMTVKVYAIIGVALCILGVAIRSLGAPAEDVIAVFSMMTIIITLILGVAYFIMILSVRRGWLDHVPLSMDIDPDKSAFASLIGKTGTTTTILAPEGTAVIEGETYFVHSDGIISEGSKVRVVSIEGTRINVVAY